MYKDIESVITNVKEENWEGIEVDWCKLGFQFCLNAGLGYSEGFWE